MVENIPRERRKVGRVDLAFARFSVEKLSRVSP